MKLDLNIPRISAYKQESFALQAYRGVHRVICVKKALL